MGMVEIRYDDQIVVDAWCAVRIPTWACYLEISSSWSIAGRPTMYHIPVHLHLEIWTRPTLINFTGPSIQCITIEILLSGMHSLFQELSRNRLTFPIKGSLSLPLHINLVSRRTWHCAYDYYLTLWRWRRLRMQTRYFYISVLVERRSLSSAFAVEALKLNNKELARGGTLDGSNVLF